MKLLGQGEPDREKCVKTNGSKHFYINEKSVYLGMLKITGDPVYYYLTLFVLSLDDVYSLIRIRIDLKGYCSSRIRNKSFPNKVPVFSTQFF
jgi:hypothetical protein